MLDLRRIFALKYFRKEILLRKCFKNLLNVKVRILINSYKILFDFDELTILKIFFLEKANKNFSWMSPNPLRGGRGLNYFLKHF